MQCLHTNAPGHHQLEWSIAENRAESRTLCQGRVRFFLEGRYAASLGDLKDVSNNGFRAAHTEPSLNPGTEVDFVHTLFRGKARVMWSRLADGLMESGFLIIRE